MIIVGVWTITKGPNKPSKENPLSGIAIDYKYKSFFSNNIWIWPDYSPGAILIVLGLLFILSLSEYFFSKIAH